MKAQCTYFTPLGEFYSVVEEVPSLQYWRDAIDKIAIQVFDSNSGMLNVTSTRGLISIGVETLRRSVWVVREITDAKQIQS